MRCCNCCYRFNKGGIINAIPIIGYHNINATISDVSYTSESSATALAAIFKNWSNGSVIRGWLVELMEKGLREQNFDGIQSYIEDTGEVNWLIQDALNKEIPIPVISQSVMELFKSRIKDSDTYKAIALMRHGFGGHPFGKDEYIAKERKNSRIAGV